MDMKNYKVVCLVGLAMLAMGLQASQGVILQTWNLGSDFSITNGNPNNLTGARAGSSWSYGLTPSSGGEPVTTSFTLLPFGTNSGGAFPAAGLEGCSYVSGNGNTGIVHNPTASLIHCCGSSPGIDWNPNDVTFDTYPGGVAPFAPFWVDARWIA